MEDQINKKRKRAIVKAVVWTALALLGMSFCLGSYYKSSYKNQYDTTISTYQKDSIALIDSIQKLNETIGTIKNIENKNEFLVKENKIKTFFENKFKSIDEEYGFVVDLNYKLINAIKDNKSNPFKSELNEHKVNALSKLDSLRKILRGEIILPDSIDYPIVKSNWESIYLRLIKEKEDLIESQIEKRECCENPPAHKAKNFSCKECLANCPDCKSKEPCPDCPPPCPCNCSDLKSTLSAIKASLESVENVKGGRGKVKGFVKDKILNKHW